jgi:hypothetical protein
MRLAQQWPLGRAGNHGFYLTWTFPQQRHMDLASCAKQDAPLWCSSPVATHVNRFFLHLQLVYRNTKKNCDTMIGESAQKTRLNISDAYCNGLIGVLRRITVFWRVTVFEVVVCTHYSSEYLAWPRVGQGDTSYRTSKVGNFNWKA